MLHLFDQPLVVTRPYEAYMGTLTIPRAVATAARDNSIHLDLLSPRRKLVEAIELTWPGLRRENIHVWTLGGKSRAPRLASLWEEWRSLGVHLVEDGWRCPSGMAAFTESGTYAPTYLVGSWTDGGGLRHVFLCDGYAASAEALQAASLAQAAIADDGPAGCRQVSQRAFAHKGGTTENDGVGDGETRGGAGAFCLRPGRIDL